MNNFFFVVLSTLTRDKPLRRFWVQCTDNDVLFVSVSKLLAQLEKSYTDALTKHKTDVTPSLGGMQKYPVRILRQNLVFFVVCRAFVSRVLDLGRVDPAVTCPNSDVTLFQLFDYVTKLDKCDLKDALQKLASEREYIIIIKLPGIISGHVGV